MQLYLICLLYYYYSSYGISDSFVIVIKIKKEGDFV